MDLYKVGQRSARDRGAEYDGRKAIMLGSELSDENPQEDRNERSRGREAQTERGEEQDCNGSEERGEG